MNNAQVVPDFSSRIDKDQIDNVDLVDDALRQSALKGTMAEWAKRPPFYAYRSGLLVTVCTRAADVREVYGDSERFTVVCPPYEGYKIFDLFGGLESVLQMDGERHDRIRRLMNPAFSPKAIRALQGDIDRIIEAKINRIASLGGEFDAVADFSRDIIVRILLDASLKLTPSQQDAFAKMHDSIGLATQFEPGKPLPADYRAAVEQVTAIIGQVIAERRLNPGQDMISNLVTATDEGRGMTEAELFGQINSICSAGLGTTAATLAGALLTLVRHPQQLEMLRENPELIDGAVEECLRFHGPGVNTFTRFAVKETTVAGHKIFKDMPVIASIQAADYDPMEFPDPLRFDITRNPRNIFAFGSGPHHCIGNRLARTILRKSLLAIVQNFPRLRLAESDFDPIYCGFPGELCMTRLPLRID